MYSASAIFFLVVFIIVIFSLSYFLNIFPTRKSGLKDLYSEGLDMLIAGRRKSAYKNFKELVSKDTNSVKAYIRLGQIMRESGSFEQALKIHKNLTLRKNLTYYDNLEIKKNLVLDYYKLDKTNRAIEQLNEILKFDKKNEWALNHIILIYKKLNNWNSAYNYLERKLSYSGQKDNHLLALYKIQEGRMLLKEQKYLESRKVFESALLLKNIPIIYYFIGISYSYQSDELYNIASQEFESQESLDIDNMDEIKSLLSKAIDMWIQYLELKPEQAWLVLHLIKDALFALDRFSEYEVILKENLKRAPNNVDMIANLSDIYSNRGESKEALDLIDSALEQDTTSLLIKIYKIKLETNRLEGSKEVVRNLDNIIKFLITDERFQVYKNKNRDRDFVWLYESSENEINEGLKV